MGITIVQKSDLSVPKPWAKKGLVLSGGAMTGASFKTGGLKALNEYFGNFTVNDFDIFVGISSGSLIAVPLAAGLTPEEMLRSLDGTSQHFTQLAPWHFYWPNAREMMTRPANFALKSMLHLPRMLWDVLGNVRGVAPRLAKRWWRFVLHPTAKNYSEFWQCLMEALTTREGPSILSLLPNGIFDNSPIERYLRQNIERNHLTNNFQVVERIRKKQLYVCAMTLDGAKRAVFGPDEMSDVTISKAVQASTALPIFYKPARIHGVDYVDGGVFETAHLDVAVDKGAELVVCYNPFRPIENEVLLEYIQKDNKYVTKGSPLASGGIMTVLNQIFRAVLHSRLHQTMRRYNESSTFTGDIILIEPRASDMAFFELNPLIYSHRTKAARIGFETVCRSIEEQYDVVEPIFKSYGIELTRERIATDLDRFKFAGQNSEEIQRVLEGRPSKRKAKTKKKRTAKSRTTKKTSKRVTKKATKKTK